MQSGPRLVYVVTHPTTAKLLLRGQLAYMREHGFDVSIISAPGSDLEQVAQREGVRTVAVPMVRGPGGPVRDVLSLQRLTKVLRSLRPEIVNASTPKAGLLGMLAARALRVPVRVYLLRGLRLETERGTLRAILGVTERMASACAHEVVCASESLRRMFVDGGYVAAAKAKVLGSGSSNGVDAAQFAPSEHNRRRARELAETLSLDPNGPNVGFVGRLSVDKGIDLLLDSVDRLRVRNPAIRLLMIGGDLADEQAPPRLLERVRRTPGIVTIGRVDDLAPYYPMMRVLAFPSRREGLPNVPLEAACAEIPTVGLRTTGVVDAIEDSVTGSLVEDASAEGFATALSRYLDDPALCTSHGRAARRRAESRFSNRIVWEAWADEYRRLLAQRGLQ